MKGRLSGQLSSHELWWVIGFCLFAAVRVLLFSAAFPFFNNVDERRHLDLVIKYAEGHIPHGTELISPATLPYLSHYASPEFLSAPESFEGGYFGPMWKHPAEEVAPTIARIEEIWSRTPNQECSQPPPYYVVAAAWFHIGQWIGFKDGGTLYWVRFLNTLLMPALVWVAYVAARLMFPEQVALRLGVPLLIATVPQDAFYGINNDVLSPICFGLLFLCLLKLFSADSLNKSWAVLTGVAFAATYLVKTGNLPLLAVAALAILFRTGQWKSVGSLRRMILPLALLASCALLPIAIWTAWFEHAFGDLTASSAKIKMLGWTAKPFLAWFEHPIFSLKGAWNFWHELIASFWRGEMHWHTQRLAASGADLFYCLSTTIFIITALVSWRTRCSVRTRIEQVSPCLSLCCFVAAICFYILLSIMFDFGNCPYPSREFPYFASGRLMSGLMIPVALLYVQGLAWCLSFTKRKWIVLLAVVLIVSGITASEIVITYPVFTSEFNFYHL